MINKKDKYNQLEELEQKVNSQLSVFKKFQENNPEQNYFLGLHGKINPERKKRFRIVSDFYLPKLSYTFLFIFSFFVSFEIFNFNSPNNFLDDNLLFSEATPWIEEESFYNENLDWNVDLDFQNYFSEEVDFANYNSLEQEISSLSDNEIDEVIQNLKSKKIL